MAYTIIDVCIGCTACIKRCPTSAITGARNEIHVIDPELCIDCGACGAVCPPEAILDDEGDLCKAFVRKEWPVALVVEENCIGSGCEICINVCPFEALSLEPAARSDDFFGVASVDPRKCTGCRLCEDSCGWSAIYIDPPREMMKKDRHPQELSRAAKAAAAKAAR